MFDTVCTLPLSSDLFVQAIHPSEPIVTVGLAAGHVQTYRLPPLAHEGRGDGTHAPENGCGTIETSWRTKRHKGSCRSLTFSVDGEALYSVGTDGLVKVASTATGQVTSKIAIPLHNSAIDAPSLVHALSPQTLLLATDSSALHLYDLRANSTFATSTPQQTHHPHDDYVSSLTPLAPTDASTSGFSKQWISTGGSTLAVTDLRRGVLVKSEDQEEELLSSVFVGGLPVKAGRRKGEKVLVGGGSGVLTLWEKGVWDDQDERIIVDGGKPGGGESLDVLAGVPEDVGEGKLVAVGMGHGKIRIVKMGVNKVVAEMSHDDLEGVIGLGFEVGGRMVSGGGPVVKVWQEKVEDEEDEVETDINAKRRKENDSDEQGSDDDRDGDSSEEEEEVERKRKRRKRNKGKDHSGNPHVMAFKGMD